MEESAIREALQTLVQESSQAAVAERCGLSQPTISRLLSGQRGGTVSSLRKLLKAYPELQRLFLSRNMPT